MSKEYVICTRESIIGIGYHFLRAYNFEIYNIDNNILFFKYKDNYVHQTIMHKGKYGSWFRFRNTTYYVVNDKEVSK